MTAGALRTELIQRADLMSYKEFSVKAQSLRNLGGFWPNSIADWQKPEGRALAHEIREARK